MEQSYNIVGDETTEKEIEWTVEETVLLTNEINESLEHLQLSKRYQEVQLELLEVDRALCDRQSKDEFIELIDGALWEKRILALEDVIGNLTAIVDNKDRLEHQLQIQFNSDKSKKLDIPYAHHKHLCKMFEMMATFLNTLESQVKLTDTVRNTTCNLGQIIPNQLNSLCRLNTWFNSFDKLHRSLHRVFEPKIH